MNELYDRLVELCKKKGEKPAVVCHKAGISASLMTDIKMGRKKGMSLSTAGKLANYLGVTVGTILGVEDQPVQQTPVAPATPVSTPAPLPAFVQNYNLLDEIDQAKVEAYISGLLSNTKYNNNKQGG